MCNIYLRTELWVWWVEDYPPRFCQTVSRVWCFLFSGDTLMMRFLRRIRKTPLEAAVGINYMHKLSRVMNLPLASIILFLLHSTIICSYYYSDFAICGYYINLWIANYVIMLNFFSSLLLYFITIILNLLYIINILFII